MALVDETRTHDSARSTDWSDEQRAEILSESHLILSHPSFKNSRRCVALFQFLIERTLAGDHENLKERILGVEVFGRDPDYDTNADPIVRMTASEIRKRLAQYYMQEDRSGHFRFQLVPGSYLPQIETVRKEAPEISGALSLEVDVREADKKRELEVAQLSPASKKAPRRFLLLAGVSLAVLMVLLVGWYELAPHARSTQDLVWAPLVQENGPMMLCVSDGYPVTSGPVTLNWAADLMQVIATHRFVSPPPADRRVPALPIVDARVATWVTSFLNSRHKETIMRQTSAMTLADLQEGPDVIVGAFDNPWFLVLLSRLRFHVMVDPTTQDEWIEDAQNPSHREWMANGKMQFSDSSADYAVISRVRSADTGTWVLAIGGLGLHGTEAAGELLTDPSLARLLPAGLRDPDKNFQIVIKTAVINGNTGPPQIVATYIW